MANHQKHPHKHKTKKRPNKRKKHTADNAIYGDAYPIKRVKRPEVIYDVMGSGSSPVQRTFPLNPGMSTYPWLSGMARKFSHYAAEYIHVTFRGELSLNAVGASFGHIWLGVNPDVNAPWDKENSYQNSGIRVKIIGDQKQVTLKIPVRELMAKRKLKVRTSDQTVGYVTEKDAYDFALLQMYVDMPTYNPDVKVGTLEIAYFYKFFNPIISNDDVVNQLGDHYISTNQSVSTLIAGKTANSTLNCDLSVGTHSTANDSIIVTLPESGYYSLTYAVKGVTVADTDVTVFTADYGTNGQVSIVGNYGGLNKKLVASDSGSIVYNTILSCAQAGGNFGIKFVGVGTTNYVNLLVTQSNFGPSGEWNVKTESDIHTQLRLLQERLATLESKTECKEEESPVVIPQARPSTSVNPLKFGFLSILLLLCLLNLVFCQQNLGVHRLINQPWKPIWYRSGININTGSVSGSANVAYMEHYATPYVAAGLETETTWDIIHCSGSPQTVTMALVVKENSEEDCTNSITTFSQNTVVTDNGGPEYNTVIANTAFLSQSCGTFAEHHTKTITMKGFIPKALIEYAKNTRFCLYYKGMGGAYVSISGYQNVVINPPAITAINLEYANYNEFSAPSDMDWDGPYGDYYNSGGIHQGLNHPFYTRYAMPTFTFNNGVEPAYMIKNYNINAPNVTLPSVIDVTIKNQTLTVSDINTNSDVRITAFNPVDLFGNLLAFGPDPKRAPTDLLFGTTFQSAYDNDTEVY